MHDISPVRGSKFQHTIPALPNHSFFHCFPPFQTCFAGAGVDVGYLPAALDHIINLVTEYPCDGSDNECRRRQNTVLLGKVPSQLHSNQNYSAVHVVYGLDKPRHGATRHDTTRCDVAQHDATQCDTTKP